jgi:formimidoylglutamase
MVPHTAPPFWPETKPGRFAAAVYKASAEGTDSQRQRGVIAKCRVGLLGLADDLGVAMNGGRTGAKDGPNALRAALARYGVARRMDETDATVFPHVFDFGNIVPAGSLAQTHARVTEAVEHILDLGLFPIGIGGGHDLTFPFVRAVAKRAGGLHGIYFDAHLDVRESEGSGMPFRRLIEECGVTRLTCVGLDRFANTREHFAWFREHGGEARDFEPSEWPRPDPACPGGQFVSIDLDVLDCSHAPGVSAMNPAGMDAGRLCSYAYAAGLAAGRGRGDGESGGKGGVRCFDIMELNPAHDPDGRTARLAARLLLECLRGMAEGA